MRPIWGDGKAEYFSQQDWMSGIALNGLAKLAFSCSRSLPAVGAVRAQDEVAELIGLPDEVGQEWRRFLGIDVRLCL
jgi:hypothetical protein